MLLHCCLPNMLILVDFETYHFQAKNILMKGSVSKVFQATCICWHISTNLTTKNSGNKSVSVHWKVIYKRNLIQRQLLNLVSIFTFPLLLGQEEPSVHDLPTHYPTVLKQHQLGMLLSLQQNQKILVRFPRSFRFEF